MGKGDTYLNAIIGAVVTIVLSFTGISPVIGGAAAGYLQAGSRRSGAKVGALAGGIAFLPFLGLVLLALLFIPVAGGGFGMPGGIELLVIMFVLFPVFLGWNVGLGALGGYLGAYLREDR